LDSNNTLSDRIDYPLPFILFLLFCVSCISIYSAQPIGQYEENFLMKQVLWYAVGIVVLAGTMLRPIAKD
jgi:rod shape determining protein RodA